MDKDKAIRTRESQLALQEMVTVSFQGLMVGGGEDLGEPGRKANTNSGLNKMVTVVDRRKI